MRFPPARDVRSLLVSVSLFLLSVETTRGQEIVAGWEGQTDRGYAFVAPGFEPRGGEHRLAIRTTASFLYYEFDDHQGRTRVRSPGIGLSAGYRLARPRLTLTVAPGVELRRIVRTTLDRETRVEVAATFQGEAFARVSERLRASAIARYGHANRYVWARGGLTCDLRRGGLVQAALGVEVTGHGNHDTRTRQLGGVLDVFLAGPGLSLQVRTGLAATDREEVRIYAGVGVYRRF